MSVIVLGNSSSSGLIAVTPKTHKNKSIPLKHSLIYLFHKQAEYKQRQMSLRTYDEFLADNLIRI